MKKVLVAVAMIMGMGTAAMANSLNNPMTIVMQVNDFTPIEVADLPQAVQDALAKDFAEKTIKEAAVETAEDGTKTFKVTLTDAAGAESIVLFNEKGEVVSEKEATPVQ